MSDTNIENQLRLANSELNRRIALLEETLREKERAGEALQDSEKRYRRLFESAKDGILILDADTGQVVDVNPFLMRLLGYSYDELYGKHLWEIGSFQDVAASKYAFKNLQNNEYIRYDDLPLETHDGQRINVEFVSNVYLVDRTKVIQCNIRDITRHKQSEAEHERLMAAIEQAGEMIVITNSEGIIHYVNPAFERTTGYSRDEALGQTPRILKSGEQDQAFYREMWKKITCGGSWRGRLVNKRKDGTLYTEEATISPVFDPSGRIVDYVSVKRDITEEIRLADQLQQARKMESVGRLAGGVAHDFNNMLSVILGYTELVKRKFNPSGPLNAALEEIRKAAERSSDLTRQLLAFARKQRVSPKVLDVNETVAGMLKMLQRLIGEDVHLVWLPGMNLWPVRVDPSQLDQILANLCLNARDAIADVGRVTIETGNVILDEAYCVNHAEFVPGEYVLLTVSDDGCGMDKEILDSIFEPFFTTKGVSQGTGLGLATVYGIVKQNNGCITVYSEQGKGTTFKIYLPRHADQAVDTQVESAAEILLSLGETVLLVEDDVSILKLAEMILQGLGYIVLTAGAPGEAMRLAEEHAGEIHLLMTDVIMPEMNGRDLAERIRSTRPAMKCLFMSGYTADVIAHRGMLVEGVCFIHKPFSIKDVATKVREALEKGE